VAGASPSEAAADIVLHYAEHGRTPPAIGRD
jgi:hypothetical protein